MRSAAGAIGWEFGRRHRWGWVGVGVYLVVLAAYRILAFGPGQTASFDDSRSFSFVVVVPAASAFMYLLAVFSFGLAGDLGGRGSIYPARLFTLPVTNAALAGWPMVFGTLAMALLWLLVRLLAVWPEAAEVPLVWPAVLAAVVLCWTQALTWMPYALPGIRVVFAVLLMTSINVVVLLALQYEASERTMVALLAPHLPLSYLVACFAVAQARRGDVPDWRSTFSRIGRLAQRALRKRTDFSSAASAQLWFEWRSHGRSLPTLVAMVLPFEMFLLFAFRETPVLVYQTLAAVLLTPSLLAFFVAATVSRSPSHRAAGRSMSMFDAARPIADVSFIAAKLKATIWSVCVAWLLVLTVLPLALALSGTSSIVAGGAASVVDALGTTRALGLGLLALGVLVLSTWKQLVQSLFIAMTGRSSWIKASVFGSLTALTVLVSLIPWLRGNRELIAGLLNSLPTILAALVCLKIVAGAWTSVCLRNRRLLSDRSLLAGALLWNVAVLTLFAVLVWLSPGLLVRSHVLLLIAILVVPLVRISLAPLAMSWNRHR